VTADGTRPSCRRDHWNQRTRVSAAGEQRAGPPPTAGHAGVRMSTRPFGGAVVAERGLAAIAHRIAACVHVRHQHTAGVAQPTIIEQPKSHVRRRVRRECPAPEQASGEAVDGVRREGLAACIPVVWPAERTTWAVKVHVTDPGPVLRCVNELVAESALVRQVLPVGARRCPSVPVGRVPVVFLVTIHWAEVPLAEACGGHLAHARPDAGLRRGGLCRAARVRGPGSRRNATPGTRSPTAHDGGGDDGEASARSGRWLTRPAPSRRRSVEEAELARVRRPGQPLARADAARVV
jgi:hypothetical protein